MPQQPCASCPSSRNQRLTTRNSAQTHLGRRGVLRLGIGAQFLRVLALVRAHLGRQLLLGFDAESFGFDLSRKAEKPQVSKTEPQPPPSRSLPAPRPPWPQVQQLSCRLSGRQLRRMHFQAAAQRRRVAVKWWSELTTRTFSSLFGSRLGASFLALRCFGWHGRRSTVNSCRTRL